MKTFEDVKMYHYAFLTLLLDGHEWSAPRSDPLTAGEIALGTNYVGSCVGLSACSNVVEKRKVSFPSRK
jgi:hypothetical protein